jgi:hypothetical protein
LNRQQFLDADAFCCRPTLLDTSKWRIQEALRQVAQLALALAFSVMLIQIYSPICLHTSELP